MDELAFVLSPAEVLGRILQAFLKKHPSLQFREGDRVWVRNRTIQPGLHPKLDRVWQDPAEILRKVSKNTYLVNLNGKEVILSVGRLKPYISRRDGVNSPLHHYSERHDLHIDSYVVDDVLDHEYRGNVRGLPPSGFRAGASETATPTTLLGCASLAGQPRGGRGRHHHHPGTGKRGGGCDLIKKRTNANQR